MIEAIHHLVGELGDAHHEERHRRRQRAAGDDAGEKQDGEPGMDVKQAVGGAGAVADPVDDVVIERREIHFA